MASDSSDFVLLIKLVLEYLNKLIFYPFASVLFGIHLSILSRSSIAFFIELNKFILLFEFIYVAVLIS